jgi:DUF4097 and DUF4098 domain-containing protein YvlB
LDVPRDVSVRVDSGAGSVTVSGMENTVDARSGAGGIDVTDCRGDLNLSSGAGKVRASGLTSASVHAQSGAGGVSLQFVAAPLNVSAASGAGSVDVEVPRDGSSYEVRGESGRGGRRIDVATAPGSTHAMVLNSGAGSTRVHYPS